MSSEQRRIVNVGLIGCGETVQVAHIPTLLFMRNWFRITFLCDVSGATVKHCSESIPYEVQTTPSPQELCASREVDVVLIASSDEYHVTHVIIALQQDKHALVEKPLALMQRDVQAIIEAEKKSKGNVMVGYMRRYAVPFEDAIREKIGGVDKILYARVRDIIGPNSAFVLQSGTFPKKFIDFDQEDGTDKNNRAKEMVKTALETEAGGIAVTEDSTRMWRLFGGLGSHDLSVMREVLGMPEKVVGSSIGFPFWNVLFKYSGFTVSYDSGIDDIPRFYAHIEVYGMAKTVKVQYDTPYVKGLPVTLHISENVSM
ncbi:NAD(P)-binding protein [Bimuria novae-zelandiae CBS 107.79]|uniref:NAD(P)-binding protein n=1 Tax=Bimuria novae-zelandiae CBS 107.79 TaxID=1447943 RepID=A0A6A5VMQ6_9PLEO|nr:NAD(P)-binding protein [Bimuria novae-zelandiae CBS 107.79]